MPDDDIELLQQWIMHGGEEAFEAVPRMLKKIITEKQWQVRADKNGKPFPSFEAFATHRLWQGLETTIDDLRVHCRKHSDVERLILKEMDEMPAHGEVGRGRSDRVDNIKSNPGGTNPTYVLKRLKRDRPDLAERVVAGELSANAAAIEAGFRKKPTPLDIVLKQWPKLTAAEQAQLCACVTGRRP